MKKWLIRKPQIFIVSALLLACAIVLIGRKSEIDIYLNPDMKLTEYQNVYFDIQNLDSHNGLDLEEMPLERELVAELRRYEFNTAYLITLQKPVPTDMILKCTFDLGWGPPASKMHFGFRFHFRKHINLVFLDAQSKKLVAKISYVRGFAAYDDDDVKKIFAALETRLKEAGEWKAKRKE